MPTAIQTYVFETGACDSEDIRTQVEALVEDEDKVYEYRGNIALSPRGTDYASPWRNETPPADVKAPQAINTTMSDEVNDAQGGLYRWFDGAYVAVDHLQTPVYSRLTLLDYMAINHGTVPDLAWGDRQEPVLDDERAVPGNHELPPSEPETERQELLFAVLRGDRDDLSLAEVAPLLELDEFYHLLASELPDAVSDTDIDRRVLDWLDSDDPAQRARAVRWIGAVESIPREGYGSDRAARNGYTPDAVPSVEGVETFERFVRAIPTVDATTQRLVAPALWEPWILGASEPPELTHLRRLTALLDADLPEIRVGALQGSARLLGEVVCRHRADDEVGPDEPLASFVEAFSAGFAVAVSDDNPMVQVRAGALATQGLAGQDRPDAVGWPTFAEKVPSETLWDITRGLAHLNDRHDGVDVERYLRSEYFGGLAERGVESIERLVSYGYEKQGPGWRKARRALTDRAEDDPELIAQHIDAPLAAVRTGSVTTADLTLLQTLVPDRPDRVATVGDDLTDLLEDSQELRLEAAWTLVLLGRERPDAVPVERDTLAEILSDVCDENGRFSETERIRRLAVADPNRAGDVLVKLAEAVAAGGQKDGWKLRKSRLGDALSAVDSGVTEVGAPFPKIPPDRHEAFAGIARGARYKTHWFTDAAGVLVEHLDSMTSGTDHVNLEALATALVAIGQCRESALPPSARPILDRADDVYDPDELDELVERVHDGDCPEARDDHPIRAVDDGLLAYDW